MLFHPGSDLQKLCKAMDFTLYKSDSKTDSKEEEPLPDGGGSDPDEGESPDPTL